MLKHFDIFGFNPTLYISDSSHYKTKPGGVTTIIVFLSTFFTCIYFGQEFFKKQSPSVSYSVEMDMHPAKIHYFSNFEFIFALQNLEETPYINTSIYFPKGYLLTTKITDKGPRNELIPVNISKCSDSPPKSHLFDTYNLEQFYCLSHQQSFELENLHISEFWGNDGFQLIQIQILSCDKGEDTSNCADTETIEKFLNQTKVTLLVLDTFIQTRQHKNPFYVGLKEYFYYVSKNTFLSSTQFLKTLRIVSDEGILYTSENEISSFGLDRVQDYTLIDSNRSQFFNFNVQLNNIVNGYYRRYYKIQDFVAQIGAIYKMAVSVGYILLYHYSKNSYYECLASHFFFHSKDSSSHQIAHANSPIICKEEPSKTFQNQSQSVFNLMNSGGSQHFHIPKDKLRPKKKKTKLKILGIKKVFPIQFLKICNCSKNNNDLNLIDFAMKIIHNYFDVEYLLKFFHDLGENTNSSKETNLQNLNVSLFRMNVLKSNQNLSLIKSKNKRVCDSTK